MIRINRTQSNSRSTAKIHSTQRSPRHLSALLRARCVKVFIPALALTFAATAFAQSKPSQDQSSQQKSCDAAPTETARRECYETTRVIRTYYLAHTFQQSDENEILIALRNMLGTEIKIYLLASRNAIVISAPPDKQTLAKGIIDELDQPKKLYRLTFTLAESDGGKRIGVQHFSMVVEAGQRATLKQGSRVPVMTGSTSDPQQTQYQYLDIGMNFDVTLDSRPGGLYLKSSVEESSLADEHMTGPLASEPILRQTKLEGSSLLTPGKPLTLGSVDVPGSTRHADIEVVADPIS